MKRMNKIIIWDGRTDALTHVQTEVHIYRGGAHLKSKQL